MTVKELLDKQKDITSAMADASEEQYRSLEVQYNANKREIEMLNQMAISERNAPVAAPKSVNAILREMAQQVLKTGQRRDVTLSVVNTGDTNNITSSGAINLHIQDLLPVLEKGLIWDKVGLKLQTGVSGDLLWPYATNSGEAEEVGETVALTDSDITFGKKTATPYRVGAEVDVTNEAIEDAAFDIQGFVTAELGRKIQRLLNKKTFGTPSFTGLKGPFAGTTPSALDCTWANIKAKKALIAAKGYDMSSFAYVCSASTKALLETTPKANGMGGFICENGTIDGDPVYVTEYVNIKSDGTFYSDKNFLMMGCWGELAGCQHGAIHFVADPYTNAGKNEVRFIVNTRYSITDLCRTAGEAFAAYDLAATNLIGTVLIGNTTDNPVNTKEVTA